MKNQWPIWVFILGVVVVVLFAFNYRSENEFVSLNDIFPEDEEKGTTEITYEFIDEPAEEAKTAAAPAAAKVTTPAVAAAPAPAPIAVTAAPAAPSAPVAKVSAAPVSTTGSFTIQVASSKDKARAEKALQAIKDKGYPAFMMEKDLGSKGLWYRTYIGRFPTKKEAEGYLGGIKKDFKDSFIIKL